MGDELIDSFQLSLPHKSVLPGAGFFYPKPFDKERAEEHAKTKFEDASVTVVTDADAGGLGCVALLRETYGTTLDVTDFGEYIEEKLADDESDEDEDKDDEDESPLNEETEGERPKPPVVLMGSSPYSLEDNLRHIAGCAPEGVEVYVCDPCPDKFEYVEEELAALAETAGEIHWYNRHQWRPEVVEAVRDAGVDLVVGGSDEECSTDVTLRELDYELNKRFSELAAVARNHDLWLNEDERSQNLANYAYWISKEGHAAAVGVCGADLPSVVEEYITHHHVGKKNLIQAAVDCAELKTVGDWTVGVTYGRYLQNGTAGAFRGASTDAVVVAKPAGSASIRGSDDFEHCHGVADLANGGGHLKAAGCKPDIYDDMLDYAHHWTTQGATTERVIPRAFEQATDTVAEAGMEATADAEADDDAEDDEGVGTER